MGSQGSKDGASSVSRTPSSAVTLMVGNEEMPTFNDDSFKRVREANDVPATFLAEGFDFRLKPEGNMSEGGGKGGNLMGFTDNRMYIIKELNNTDHNTLLRYAGEYADHMTHSDGTLLCNILAHFYNPTRDHNYLVMNNVIPDPPENSGGMLLTSESALQSERSSGDETPMPSELDTRASLNKRRKSAYDLKGCNDDKILVDDGEGVEEVHKRIFYVHMWFGQCCWSDERKKYFSGKKRAKMQKFYITPQQRTDMIKWLRTSVSFLVERNLMDYSLMVSCQVVDFDDPAAEVLQRAYETSMHAKITDPFPFISKHDGKLQVLHVGIIDFLQDWTCTKNIAMCIKVFERNKATVPPSTYGARFIEHFTNSFVGEAEDVPPLASV